MIGITMVSKGRDDCSPPLHPTKSRTITGAWMLWESRSCAFLTIQAYVMQSALNVSLYLGMNGIALFNMMPKVLSLSPHSKTISSTKILSLMDTMPGGPVNASLVDCSDKFWGD